MQVLVPRPALLRRRGTGRQSQNCEEHRDPGHGFSPAYTGPGQAAPGPVLLRNAGSIGLFQVGYMNASKSFFC